MATEESIPQEVEDVIADSKAKVVASMLITGSTYVAISKHLGITRFALVKLMKTEEFREQLAVMSDQMVTTAANTWRGMMQELVPLAHTALKKALERGDLKGVEIIIKSLGIDKQTAQVQQGTLQVILPEFNKPKDIVHE